MSFLVSEFITFFFIVVRVSAAIFTAPVFSNSSVPVTARLFLSLVISYVLLFTVKPVALTYESGLGIMALYAVKEALTGMIMGFSLNFVFYAVSFAGVQMGMDIGFGMATMFDPSTEIENNLIGQVFNLGALMIFLVINGHHYIIRGLSASFQVIPVGTGSLKPELLDLFVKYTAGVFVVAVKIAAPIMVAFFLIHIAAGIISRIIPQMQVFFVLQPVQLGVGLLLVATAVPFVVHMLKVLLEQTEGQLFELLRVMAQ